MLAALCRSVFFLYLCENSCNTYARSCKTYARLRTSSGSFWTSFCWVSLIHWTQVCGHSCCPWTTARPTSTFRCNSSCDSFLEGCGVQTQWHGWNSSRSRVAVWGRRTSLAACSPWPSPKACWMSRARTAVSSTVLYRSVPLNHVSALIYHFVGGQDLRYVCLWMNWWTFQIYGLQPLLIDKSWYLLLP